MNWNEPIVLPRTLRIDLDGGRAWIEVKKHLTHGERSNLTKYYTPTLQASVEFRTALVATYIVAWSLTMNDKPLPWPIGGRGDEAARNEATRIDTLRSMGTHHFDAIFEAVDQHFAAIEKADAEEKNGQDGANGSPVISPLPDSVTGAITMS